jgi:hypothetical protein
LTSGDRSRRFPRLRARCRVRIRDRFGTWSAETEDVGPRGCRLVGERAHALGALVRLTVESDRIVEPLEVAGQVVWTRADRLSRAGIWFAGAPSSPGAPFPAAWFAALAAAEIAFERRRAANGRPSEARAAPCQLPAPLVEIVVEPPDGDAGRDPLAQRLLDRARELIGEGRGAPADVILSRAAALAPGDAEIEALLRSARHVAE